MYGVRTKYKKMVKGTKQSAVTAVASVTRERRRSVDENYQENIKYVHLVKYTKHVLFYGSDIKYRCVGYKKRK